MTNDTMTIRRHRDGTYSITGMTNADVHNLAFAVSAAECWYNEPRNIAALGTADDFVARRKGAFSRLGIYLRRVAETTSSVRVVLRSDRFDPLLPAYEQVVAS